jgi:hypothetical protein
MLEEPFQSQQQFREWELSFHQNVSRVLAITFGLHIGFGCLNMGYRYKARDLRFRRIRLEIHWELRNLYHFKYSTSNFAFEVTDHLNMGYSFNHLHQIPEGPLCCQNRTIKVGVTSTPVDNPNVY